MSAGALCLLTAGIGGCGLEEAEKAFLLVGVACAEVRRSVGRSYSHSRCQGAWAESRAAGVGGGEPQVPI